MRARKSRDGARAIDPIDGDALCQLLKERGQGAKVQQVIHAEVDIVSEFSRKSELFAAV